MSLVYVAAPLGAPTAALRAWHRERATLLCALAFAMGLVPVCVHPYAETAMGSDADPDARARGLAYALAAVEAVAKAGGALWVLRREDGTLSAGCQEESSRWLVLNARRCGGRRPYSDDWGPWGAYQRLAVRYAPHLLPEFDRLATPPESAP